MKLQTCHNESYKKADTQSKRYILAADWGKVFKEIHRALTRKFPFGVFFIVKDDVITVTAIVHLARHPKTWKKR